MIAAAQWLESHGGWMVLLAVPFIAVGILILLVSLIAFLRLLLMLVADLVEWGAPRIDPRARRYRREPPCGVESHLAYREALRRELDEMQARGEIVWTPSQTDPRSRPT